jgi:hypothetical protein
MKTKITIVSQFCIPILTVAALSVAGVAMAQDTPAGKSSSLSVKDKTFMKKAAKGGMMLQWGSSLSKTAKART